MSGEGGHIKATHYSFHFRRCSEIKRCGEELGVNLAISLHATRDDCVMSWFLLIESIPLQLLMLAVVSRIIKCAAYYLGVCNAKWD